MRRRTDKSASMKTRDHYEDHRAIHKLFCFPAISVLEIERIHHRRQGMCDENPKPIQGETGEKIRYSSEIVAMTEELASSI